MKERRFIKGTSRLLFLASINKKKKLQEIDPLDIISNSLRLYFIISWQLQVLFWPQRCEIVLYPLPLTRLRHTDPLTIPRFPVFPTLSSHLGIIFICSLRANNKQKLKMERRKSVAYINASYFLALQDIPESHLGGCLFCGGAWPFLRPVSSVVGGAAGREPAVSDQTRVFTSARPAHKVEFKTWSANYL